MNEVEKIVKKLNESVGNQWRGMKKRRELQTIENERVVPNEYVILESHKFEFMTLQTS